MITFESVSFGYENRQTLDNISFQIEKGEFAAIIGANGAGKTTVSKLINGILKPTEGRVIVKNKDTKTIRTSELAKTIGFLFQNPDRQICQNSIKDEIFFGLKNVLSDVAEIGRRCNETLDSFGFNGLDDPFSKSRGERQRIALASILAIRPEILVLDEPTTGLDYRECIHIMGIIKELNEQGTTIIIITHDMEIVQDFAKRVLVMSGGKLMADGDKTEIFTNTGLMKEASIMPPQMTELALGLGDNFALAQSVTDVVNIIMQLKGVV